MALGPLWISNFLHYDLLRADSWDWCLYLYKNRLDVVMLRTHAVIQSAVDCSLHPAAPAALSLVPHLLWGSVQGTRRVSSPILSDPACCCQSPEKSASVRWCWSGAWPPLLEAQSPKVVCQPWYKEMRTGAARRERRPCFIYAKIKCSSEKVWISVIQTKISRIICFLILYCSQTCAKPCKNRAAK